MPAREWRGPGAADENARGRGRDRVDVSVENWVQDFQQRRTFGKTNRYISPTSSAHVWVLRRTRARAVLAASVKSPHLRPRDTHRRRSSSPVPCPHTRSSGLSALSTGGDRRLHGAWAAITTELLEAVRSQGPLAAALPRRAEARAVAAPPPPSAGLPPTAAPRRRRRHRHTWAPPRTRAGCARTPSRPSWARASRRPNSSRSSARAGSRSSPPSEAASERARGEVRCGAHLTSPSYNP